MKQKLSFMKLFSINFYSFGLSFLWNTLHPIVLPAILLNYVPETSKNTYLGLLTFLGLILAMIVQPVSGALSDRSNSRWGKRSPFIALGTLLNAGVLLFMGFSNSLLGIFLGYITLQVSSNIAQGPMQALIPDIVPEEQKGLASGVKNFMEVFGIICASLFAGMLLSPDSSNPLPIFLVVIGILCVAALFTLSATRIKKEIKKEERKIAGKISFKKIFSLDVKKNRAFSNLLITRFVFLLGVYGIQTFALYYIRDVLKVENAITATGSLMGVIAVALVICALISGWLSDHSGPEKLMNIAVLITALGGLALIFVRDMSSLMIVAGIIGGGMGFYLTSNWAMAVKLTPSDQAGRFLGLTNIATAGASALGRLEGPLIDFLNKIQPASFLGYKFVFFFCFYCSLLSFFLYSKLKKKAQVAAKLQN